MYCQCTSAHLLCDKYIVKHLVDDDNKPTGRERDLTNPNPNPNFCNFQAT